MTTTTLLPPAQARLRPLSDAYVELMLQCAQADPFLGPVALVQAHDDDKPQPLHRGTLKALYRLGGTADPESIAALADSLHELYEIVLTTVQVKTLLELAARTGDLVYAENQARSISLAADGSAQVEAYGALIRFERDWWTIAGRDGQKFATCPQLDSALHHARLLKRHALNNR